MGISVKVSSSGSSTDWRTIKKIWAKNNSGWQSINALYSKVVNGWTKMWPGNAPSVRLTDPIRIRIGGYSGTGSGTAPLYAATSPQLFCSTDAGTSGTFLKLWGDDGSYDGVTPITLSNRRMLVSDNVDGQVERLSLTGNDTVDFSTLSVANRDLAEAYYTFYQLKATNADGEFEAYSQPIKVIKRRPALVNYTVLSETGGVLQGANGYSAFDVVEVNAQIRWGWWIKPGGYLGGTPLLRWWKNTSKSPGGTLLKSINIETGYNYVSGSTDVNFLSDTNTSNVLTIYNNYSVGSSPLSSGQYIVAELYLENSYTAEPGNSPVSYWGSTGAAPTITSVSLRTYDGQVDTVMDNQSSPRIVSQAYFEIVAEVADYTSGTTFNFEPTFYKADTGVYLNYNSGGTITNGDATTFPTDVSPYSVSVSGTSATVIWRTYINSNFLPPNPTYGGGQAKYQFNFRLSATKSGGSPSYYTGLVSSNHAGNTIYPTYMNGDIGGSIGIHPHTQSVLTANNYTVGSAPQTIRFSVTGDSYPTGNASYPRSYGIDFGDGNVENLAWPTGTSNPSYTTWDHTYTTNGVFTARLITVPQGFTTIGTRQQVINVGGGIATPTSLTATTTRQDGVNLIFGGSSNATGYNIFWNYTADGNPINNVTQGDFLNKSSPFLDTTILSLATRYYWVQARGAVSDGYSTGVSPWFPTGNGIIGTRAAATSYTVTWNGQSGTVGTEGSPWSFIEGGSVTVPSVTRTGYTFVRWTDTASLDYTYTTTGGTFFPPAQNITMYARWQANPAPTAIELAAPVVTRTSGTYNYSTTNGSWNNSPTAYSYQWKAQTSLPYPPYYSTVNVGTDSSSYTSSSTYNYYSIYCIVTASNSGGSGTAISNSIQNTPAGVAPSGGGVTLTPEGTQMAGVVISANVTAMSGTEPITYVTTIRKATGSSPTGSDTATTPRTGLTNPGTGTGNAVAQHEITTGEASGTPDQFKAYTVGTNAYGNFTVGSSTVISTPYVAPGVAPVNTTAPEVTPTSGTAGGTTYTCNPGVWTGDPSPTITYQWQNNDQGSLFLSISGATSSTYSPPSNYLSNYMSPIRCKVTATNATSAVAAYSNTATVGAYVPAATAPSDGGVTLTPSGTQQAGTQICANVTAMSGTNPITYSTVIRKATGQTPTGISGAGGTTVSSGTGTGNAVCCHTITANEASGTPDHFKAYTVGTNSAGEFTVGSNIVISTPAVATTTTTTTAATTTTTAAPYPTLLSGYHYCAAGDAPNPASPCPSNGSGTGVNCVDGGASGASCSIATTTTTTTAATTTTTAAPTYPTLLSGYHYCAAGDAPNPASPCPSNGSGTGVNCVDGGASGASCSIATTTTTAAATTTTTTAATTTTARPLVYWKCNQTDVNNSSNPCSYVGQCLYDGNTYFPAGC